MGMVSKFKIEESEESLISSFKSSKSFKVRLRIQSLLLLKQKKFKRQVDLAEYLGVNHSSLKRWIKQYKDLGYDSLVSLESGGNYKGVISADLHQELEAKVNNPNEPLLGYWHAVDWVKENFNQEIKYQTLRSYLIRHFHTKKKHPRKSHYKKDEQALEVFKKTP